MIAECLSIGANNHLQIGGLDTVELAKQYCGDSSPRYINGVLAAVVRERSNTDAETR